MLHQPRSYWPQVFQMVEVWWTWVNVLPDRTTGIFNCMPWLHQLRWYYLQVFQMVGGMCQQQRLLISVNKIVMLGRRAVENEMLVHKLKVSFVVLS